MTRQLNKKDLDLRTWVFRCCLCPGLYGRILTISLVFWTQMRKESLCRKKISQVSMYVALFTLALIGDCQF
jgi:hypothetical protein